MSFNRVLVLLCCIACAPLAAAQQPEPLGPKFQSLAAGIALRPPAGTRQVRGAIGSSDVVHFLDENRKWAIRLTRVLLEPEKPLPLSSWKDKSGVDQPGMLEWNVQQFKSDKPAAQILRQDVTTVGKLEVGMVAAKYEIGSETTLFQQAIICANTLQYYILTMTCPAPRGGELETDPSVRSAVQTFLQVLESVELLDQSSIRQDQDERLYRTRALFVSINERKLRSVLQKEQWFRFIRDGKDVGYTYVTEEVARDLPRKGRLEASAGPEGVLVGVRSRLLPDTGIQIDGESWLFCTFDRKSEAFSTIAYRQDPKAGKTTMGEIGTSHYRDEKPVAPKPGPAELGGDKQGVSITDEYRLEVNKIRTNVTRTEPIVRNLPPYYLPQAIGQLLPRIVSSVRDPKTYLFATWVSDAEQIMYRYVDVEREQEVTLGGRRFRAIPVKDRVGLEGPITTHYVSPEGQYLGSVNEETKITILPTDAAFLEREWRDINLTRPGDVDGK